MFAYILNHRRPFNDWVKFHTHQRVWIFHFLPLDYKIVGEGTVSSSSFLTFLLVLKCSLHPNPFLLGYISIPWTSNHPVWKAISSLAPDMMSNYGTADWIGLVRIHMVKTSSKPHRDSWYRKILKRSVFLGCWQWKTHTTLFCFSDTMAHGKTNWNTKHFFMLPFTAFLSLLLISLFLQKLRPVLFPASVRQVISATH